MWPMLARPAGLVSLVCTVVMAFLLVGGAPAASPAGAAEPLRGLYVFGHEVRTFQPCGSEAVFWIRASGEVLARLREEHRRLATRPYQELYLVAWSEVGDPPTDGFALAYDGQIVIEDIVVVRERHDVHCRPTARPEEVYIADRGVVCNRRQEVCYDHVGASIGLTGLFRGAAAADRLSARLRATDPDARDRSRFEVADGIECRAETCSCLVDGIVDPLLGPGPVRLCHTPPHVTVSYACPLGPAPRPGYACTFPCSGRRGANARPARGDRANQGGHDDADQARRRERCRAGHACRLGAARRRHQFDHFGGVLLRRGWRLPAARPMA